MRWGEEVPAEVYERLKADKESDGILGETLYAKKNGSLAESVGEIVGDLGVGATRSGHTNKGSRCSSSALGPSVAIRSARSSLRRGERPTAGSDEGS